MKKGMSFTGVEHFTFGPENNLRIFPPKFIQVQTQK
jgi:hypothetical protein